MDCDIYRGTVNAGAALWVPVASLVAERAKGGDSFMIRTGAIVAEKEESLMSLDALKVLRGGGLVDSNVLSQYASESKVLGERPAAA